MASETGKKCIGIYVKFSDTFDDLLRAIASDTRGLPQALSYVVKQPHLILFHGVVREDVDLAAIKRQVDEIHRFCRHEMVPFREFCVDEDRVLLLRPMRTWSLRAAHAMAVVALLPHLDRDALEAAHQEGLSLPTKERENLRTFGQRLAGELYRPHLILASAPDPKTIWSHSALSRRPPEAQCTEAVKMGLMGDYGLLDSSL